MRILVTGSRDWRNRDAVWDALADAAARSSTALHDIIVVHGDCPTGADHDAYLWTLATGTTHEPHPADWTTHGRKAGPIRNRQMVRLGAEECLAFSRPCTSEKCPIIAVHGSHGTTETIDLAIRARIKTTIFKEGW